MEELDCLEAGSTALDDLDAETADSDVSLPNSYSSAWAPILFIDLVLWCFVGCLVVGP